MSDQDSAAPVAILPFGEMFVVVAEYNESQDDDVKRLDLIWNDEVLSLEITAGLEKRIYRSEPLFLLAPAVEN